MAATKRRKTAVGSVPTKRSSRAAPHKQRKQPAQPAAEWAYRTVKMKLRTFITAEGAELAWGSVLADMNKMVAEACILAGVHVARCCELEVNIPILARSFFQQCLSAVSGDDLHHPRTTMTDFFRESVTLYLSWRGNTPLARRNYVNRGWAQVVATRMAGETQRHLQYNFYRRLKQYVGLRYDLADQERYAILQGILSTEYDGDD
jgi:hypothetical protein